MQNLSGLENIDKLGKVLVTGAGGFVGGYLARYLSHFGVAVRAMVRPGSDYSDLSKQGIETVEADLLDRSSLENALKGVECIAHIAALFRRAGLPESMFHQVNVLGTQSLLEAAIASGVSRFVHCSTVGVHSNITNPPGDETTPYSPHDIYQKTKMEGECLVLEAFKQGRIKGVVIRPAMIYGPGDYRTLKLFRAIAKRRFFFVGPGDAHVHFIDVRDLVRSFALALVKKEVSGEVFIISGKESVPLKDLTKRIAAICDVPAPKLHLPLKPIQWIGSACEAICKPLRIEPPIYRRRVDFFVNNRHFTSKKAEQLLGFSPTLSLNQELREIIDWYVFHKLLNLPQTSKLLSSSALPQLGKMGAIKGNPFDATQGSSNQHTQLAQAECGRASVLLRSVEGTIGAWQGQSERLYGWDRFEAEGRISHHILQTEFPISLKAINEELLDTKKWEGKLLHRHRLGQAIEVNSRWELVENQRNGDMEVKRLGDATPFVIESNEPVNQEGNWLASSKGFASQSGFLFLLDSLSFL